MLFLLTAALAADPAALTEYRDTRLVRSAYVVDGTTVTLAERWDPLRAPTEWAVFTGAGTLLNAEAFATEVNDNGMLTRLEKRAVRDETRQGLTTVAAIVAASAGQSLGASGAPTLPDSNSVPEVRSPTWLQLQQDQPVSRYYTAELVDELIVAHNAALRRSLGLTAEEVEAAIR